MDHDKVDSLAQTLMRLLRESCEKNGGAFDAVDDVFEVHGRFSANVLASDLLDALDEHEKTDIST